MTILRTLTWLGALCQGMGIGVLTGWEPLLTGAGFLVAGLTAVAAYFYGFNMQHGGP